MQDILIDCLKLNKISFIFVVSASAYLSGKILKFKSGSLYIPYFGSLNYSIKIINKLFLKFFIFLMLEIFVIFILLVGYLYVYILKISNSMCSKQFRKIEKKEYCHPQYIIYNDIEQFSDNRFFCIKRKHFFAYICLCKKYFIFKLIITKLNSIALIIF